MSQAALSAGCDVCVVLLYSLVFFVCLVFSLLWEAGKFRIEEILILAVQQTTKPYSDHLKFVQFVEIPSVACIFPVQFLLVVFIWSKLK